MLIAHCSPCTERCFHKSCLVRGRDPYTIKDSDYLRVRFTDDRDLFGNDADATDKDLDDKAQHICVPPQKINLVVKAGQVIGTLVIMEAFSSQANAQGIPSITSPAHQYIAE